MHMYFWNIKKLKKEITTSPLSEKEQFKYLIANTIALGSAMIPFPENNIWDIYLIMIQGVIMILGIIYIYKSNGGAKGKYLLQRYFSLGWVMLIRWLFLIVLPAIIVFSLAMEMFFVGLLESTSIYDVVFVSILSIIYFLLLGKHIKSIAVKS